MNKAFLKESDDHGEGRCPRCDSRGVPVGRETLEAFVQKDSLGKIAESGFFCPLASCSVVYFDDFGRGLESDSLIRAVYPKDLEAPICGCFGFTTAEIEEDLKESFPIRIRELLAKSKTSAARCVILSASGQCCIPEVQRYYMKRRSAAGSS